MKKNSFTALYKKTGKWYSAWIEEIPGVNTQGKTLREARKNLKDALIMVLESNRISSRPRFKSGVIKEDLVVSI